MCRVGGGWCPGGLGGGSGWAPSAAFPPSRVSVSYLGTPRMILHQLAQVGCVGRRRSTNLRHPTRRGAAIPVCETDRRPAPSTAALRPVPSGESQPQRANRRRRTVADGPELASRIQSRTDRHHPPRESGARVLTRTRCSRRAANGAQPALSSKAALTSATHDRQLTAGRGNRSDRSRRQAVAMSVMPAGSGSECSTRSRWVGRVRAT
jgi:hypothetical protein